MTFGQKMLGLVAYRQKARDRRRFGEQKLYESTSFHRKLRQISYHILLLDWMHADRAI